MDKMQQAQKLIEQNNLDEALKLVTEVIKAQPASFEAYPKAANIFFRQQKYDDIARIYLQWGKALQEAGKNDEAFNTYKEFFELERTSANTKEYKVDLEVLQQVIDKVRGEVLNEMGVILLAKELLDEAMQYFQAGIQVAPTMASLHTHLGQVFIKKGMDKEAIGEFQEVVRLAPQESAYAYEMLGEIFIRSGKPPQSTLIWFRNAGDLYNRHEKFSEAARVYERILSFEPKNKDVLNRIGQIYAQLGWMDQATSVYERLAFIYTEEGLLDKVIMLYEKMVDWNPDDVKIREKVIDMYRKVLSLDPSNLSARNKLIGSLLRKGAVEEASEEFLALAKAYFEKGMYDEAEQVTKKLLDLHSDNIKASEILASVYLKKNQQEAALKEYMRLIRNLRASGEDQKVYDYSQKLLTLFPQRYEIHLQLGRSYKERGNYEEALKELEFVLKNDHQNVEALTTKAEILDLLHREEDAYKIYLDVASVEEDNLTVRDRLLQYYLQRSEIVKAKEEFDIIYHMLLQKGSAKEAEAALDKLLAFLPEDLSLREKKLERMQARGDVEQIEQELLFLASLYQNRKDYENSVRLWERLVALAPNNLNARYGLGRVQNYLGRFTEAQEQFSYLAQVYLDANLWDKSITLLNEALELAPHNVEYRNKLISILIKQLKFDEAAEHYKILVKIYLDERNYHEAQKVAKELISLYPFNLDLRQTLSQQFIECGALEQAEELLNDLAVIYLQQNRYAQAGDIYERLADLYKEQHQLTQYWSKKSDRAELYLAENQESYARHLINEVLKGTLRDELWEHAVTIENIILNTYLKGERLALIEWLKEVLGELAASGSVAQERFLHKRLEALLGETGNFKAQETELIWLAHSFEDTGEFEDARGIWERVIELSPAKNYEGAETAYKALISLYLKEQELEKALAVFSQGLSAVNETSKLQSIVAQLLFENGFYQEAETLYQEILTKHPDDTEGNMCLAIMAAYRGEFKLAAQYMRYLWGKAKVGYVISAFQKRISGLYRRGEYYLSMGKFYQELGFMNDAILEFQKALAIPKTALGAHNLIAAIFKSEGKPELAIRQVLKGLETPGFLEEEYLDLRYNLALLYEEVGRLKEALGALQECYAIDIRYKDVEERIKDINDKLELETRI